MSNKAAFQQYFEDVSRSYKSGNSTEHTYRPYLQSLLQSLLPDSIRVTNEPKRIECGAPDYILTRGDIPAGYIEAKDVGVDLDSKSLKEQFTRYRTSLDNLIITDYLEFRFYRNGELTVKVKIAELNSGKIVPQPDRLDELANLISDFAAWQGQSITSPARLASMMASKARMLANVIEKAVERDERRSDKSELRDQLEAFKTILIHNLDAKSFADLYAQTIAYGMFAARLHDPSLESFSRIEASTLIPRSNPFLRKLFNSIGGPDLDTRIVWIVDALADIFRATDVAKLLSGFGKSSGRQDAFMHFYEDFLAQYDPKLRKSRGVWYTPDAVVRFIVRAVDDILKTEFDLPMGLADTSTTEIELATQNVDKRTASGRKTERRTVHRMQVLDPATGTGTFLAEVIRQVHAKFEGQEGTWPQYVQEHLIPRLNGFEILMASYAMAHLKLDLMLRETGYDKFNQGNGRGDEQRFRVFLTDTLEEAHPDTGTLFASWLSQEANEANEVKRDTPVMVVLGNPPYSGISSNKGEWISSLIEDYKYVDGEHFREKKHWLGDDYVKFIRYGEHFIEKTGAGVLAYINNHSFLDNPTFRGMRWHLLNTFDKIYVIDLHGNAKKKEKSPNSTKDENVFDIQQGVSINIFVRTAHKKKGQLGKVFHIDLWGSREDKYRVLADGRLSKLMFKPAKYTPPYYFMQPKDVGALSDYDKGFSVDLMFTVNVTGIVTARDSFVIDIDKASLKRRIEDFTDLSRSDEETRLHFFGNATDGKCPAGDSRGWKLPDARRAITGLDHEDQIRRLSYRPFDDRFVYYHQRMVDWGREKIMRHVLDGPNVGLVVPRQTKESVGGFVSKHIIGHKLFSAYDINNFFPLYLYPETTRQTVALSHGVQPNLDAKLVEQLAKGVGLTYRFDANELWSHGMGKDLTPLDVLDYCYAVLHSPSYREKYKEFLKSDFPRIPYPTDAKKFRALIELGARLRRLHLLEDPEVEQFITKFPAPGNNTVTRKITSKSPGYEPTGKGLCNVWINDDQYFADVPEVAWNFYIGGYQPAQKWLKDRVGRQLTLDDIRHYQRMIVSLQRTSEIMQDIDAIGVVADT